MCAHKCVYIKTLCNTVYVLAAEASVVLSLFITIFTVNDSLVEHTHIDDNAKSLSIYKMCKSQGTGSISEEENLFRNLNGNSFVERQ